MANVTIKGFITECELYPYSKENYELMRECAELKLINRLLENTAFVNAYSESEEIASMDPGYLQESVDDTSYTALLTEAENKAASAWNRIKAWCIRMVERFKLALDKVLRALGSERASAQAIVNELKLHKPSDEEVSALAQVVADVFDSYKDTVTLPGIVTGNPQPGASKLRDAIGHPQSKPYAQAPGLTGYRTEYLSAILSDKATIYPCIREAEHAIDPEVLLDCINWVYTGGKKGKDVATVDQINKFARAACEDGIHLDTTDSGKLSKLVKKAQAIYDKLNAQQTSDNAKKETTVKVDPDVLSAISAALADTTKVLTTYATGRKTALKGMTAWVKQRNATAKQAKKDEKAAAKEQKKAEKDQE